MAEQRLRWAESEWSSVLGEALPLIDKGMNKRDALVKAQKKVLPKIRHRTREQLAATCAPSNGGFEKALALFNALPAFERAALMPTPPPPKPEKPKKSEREGIVRWTTRENAIAAAGVAILKNEPENADAKLYDLYIQAQPVCLEPDRQRSEDGLKTGYYNKVLQRQYADGLADAWKFPDTKNPFRFVQPAEAVAAPTPEPEPVQELAKLGANPLDAAVLLFGSSMMTALDQLLQARDANQAQQVARSIAEQTAALPERIGPIVQELLQVQVGFIATEVTKRVREMLVQEIGGPSGSSPPAAAATTPQRPADALPGRVLCIDVIGTIDPEWRQRIRDAAGTEDELHFIDFAKAGEFAPHRGRHLIISQEGKLPRALQKKIEVTGIKPVYVRSAGGHVLRAVQDLKGSAGSATLQ